MNRALGLASRGRARFARWRWLGCALVARRGVVVVGVVPRDVWGRHAAQSPAAIEPVTFDEAIRRATTANPSVAIAAANILRAEAILQQARAATRPVISAEAANVTLDSARKVDDDVVTPQNTFSASIPVSMPLYAPAQWARRTQADDQRRVAQAIGRRHPAAGRGRGGPVVPDGDRGTPRRRGAGAVPRHGEGVLRLRQRAVQGRRQQPAQPAPRATDAVERPGAGRTGATGALSDAGGAWRVAGGPTIPSTRPTSRPSRSRRRATPRRPRRRSGCAPTSSCSRSKWRPPVASSTTAARSGIRRWSGSSSRCSSSRDRCSRRKPAGARCSSSRRRCSIPVCARAASSSGRRPCSSRK